MSVPANLPPRADRFTATGEEPIRPGTWWRLIDPDHEIAARAWETGVAPS